MFDRSESCRLPVKDELWASDAHLDLTFAGCIRTNAIGVPGTDVVGTRTEGLPGCSHAIWRTRDTLACCFEALGRYGDNDEALSGYPSSGFRRPKIR